jgi:hypothetical protein
MIHYVLTFNLFSYKWCKRYRTEKSDDNFRLCLKDDIIQLLRLDFIVLPWELPRHDDGAQAQGTYRSQSGLLPVYTHARFRVRMLSKS